jgi:phenylpropionate dioxygenase-like ring-hydroxylating dioxygenase large terminal subunit
VNAAALRDELARGAIPGYVYSDPDVFARERTHVFGRTWNCLGHESEVPLPGDYVVRYIGDDSLIVTRGSDGVVRAFHNVCRHRGMEICRAETGNATQHTCPYHAWTYDLDGRLTGVPMEKPGYGPSGLQKADFGLLPVAQFGIYNGLMFANFDASAPDLRTWLGDFAWYLDLVLARTPLGFEVTGPPQRWITGGNWKMASENFIGDSYHAAFTHRSVMEIGLHPNTMRDWTKGGNRHGVHVQVEPGSLGFTRLAPAQRGYPAELVELFQKTLPPVQACLLSEPEPRWPSRMHLYPNLSFLGGACYVAPGVQIPFLTMRVWRPIGPASMEVWSWVLVEREAHPEFKRLSQRAYMLTFGSSGTEEQDDAENWTSIARASRGPAAGAMEQLLTMNVAQNLPPVVADWPGPGTAYDTTYADIGQRWLLERWLSDMGTQW